MTNIPEGLGDEEGEGDGDAGEEQDANGNNVSKKKPKYSKEEMRKIKDEIKEGMLSAAQVASVIHSVHPNA